MRILSGVQPSGRPHLGNYFGAMRQFVNLQNEGEALYFVADLHALTSVRNGKELSQHSRDVALDYLALGLDPEKTSLFLQSDIPEVTELFWILSALTPMGLLERAHSYKDKVAKGISPDAGLFTYPVLMAADVLAYRAQEVPVGEDQRQHIELMRNAAERFNSRFGETLVVPEGVIPAVGARIMDLQVPEKKMSTTGGSPQGTVYVTDEPSAIMKKFKSAVTDSGREVKRGPDKAGVSNLLEILSVVRGVSMDELEAEFEGKGYGDFKTAVGEAVVDYLAPVRERYFELRGDVAELERLLGIGAGKAAAIAAGTMVDVRAAMGVGPVG